MMDLEMSEVEEESINTKESDRVSVTDPESPTVTDCRISS